MLHAVRSPDLRVYRTVLGLQGSGAALRKIFAADSCGSTSAQLPSVTVGCTVQLPRVVTCYLPPVPLVRLVLAVVLAASPPELGCRGTRFEFESILSNYYVFMHVLHACYM